MCESRPRLGLLVATTIAIVVATDCHAAITIDNFSAEEHDRFFGEPNPNFILDGFDLSGVARASSGRWVTMVSPTHFLTANHFRPSVNEAVTFHHDNDPNGLTTTRTVQGGQRIGTTDLYVGTLNAAVGADVAIYDLASVNTAGLTVFQAGVSPTAPYGSTPTTRIAVGRNVFDAVGTFLGSPGVAYIDDSEAGDLDDVIPVPPPDPPPAPGPAAMPMEGLNIVDGETYYQVGDSGGPSFIIDGNELLLFGIHAVNGFAELNSGDVRRFSGDSSIVDLRGQVIAAIPEPSLGIWSTVLLLASFSRCRRTTPMRRSLQ